MTKEELEKENEELKAKNKWYSEQICNKECKEVWGQVEELQKENAELKEQNGSYEQLIDKGSVTLAQERLKNYKQLTKAKFLLKQLVDAFPKSYSDVVKDTLDEARKFVEE